jgi:GNAT superfamily N-acetyltransferase
VSGDETLIHGYVCQLAEYERLCHEVTASAEDMGKALFSPNPRAFCEIAEWDGAPCGMALWFYNFSTFHGRHGLYLEDLFVDPKWRGKGVGKALLKYLAALCSAQGLTRLQWWVLDWNKPAIEFYKSLGAEAMDEWTVFRVSGEALTRLAET